MLLYIHHNCHLKKHLLFLTNIKPLDLFFVDLFF